VAAAGYDAVVIHDDTVHGGALRVKCGSCGNYADYLHSCKIMI
jgi:ribosomal protein S27E